MAGIRASVTATPSVGRPRLIGGKVFGYLFVAHNKGTSMPRLLLLLASLVVCGCFNNSPPVHFVCPNGFRGPIELILDPSQGSEPVLRNDVYWFHIRDDGVLRLTSFAPLQPGWHTETAAFEDGTPIPQEHDAWSGPNGEPPKLDKTAIVFSGGGLSRRNNDPPVITFFVGSTVDYEAWQNQRWTPLPR